jgi:DNA polymerase III subunit alpha
MYQPLHVHTHYSLMDGVATAEEYVERAKANGQTAIAVTDHGTLSGHADMYRAAKAGGIKPILGIEAYYTFDNTDRRERKDREESDPIYHHLVILAKNTAGLRNLNKLSELAWLEGYFHKPRMDWDTLQTYGKDVIVLSGCMSGPINKALEHGDVAQAKAVAQQFKDQFGDDFYIEVMPHNIAGMNTKLLELADSMGIKAVATPDCHHAVTDQKEIQEMMLLLNTHQKLNRGATYEASCKCGSMMDRFDYLYGADRRMSFKDFDIHLLSPEEMRAAMEADGVFRDDIYANTCAIADSIEDYDMPEGLDVLPVEYVDPDKTLRGYAIKGLKERGLTTQEYKDRLDEELAIIKGKGFAPYFLMVFNITNYAHKRGIRMSPGRGSAAGSLVSYALKITNLDPIKNNLLFFRFIDPSRDDAPDIDMDFMDKRREEIKQFTAKKYGYVASIATFNEFGDKSVIRDVSRVLNVPLDRVNRALKQVNDWNDFVNSKSPAVKEFRDDYPEVIEFADKLHGRIRTTGVHAAGVVASKVPLNEVAPIETRSMKGNPERITIVAVDKDEAERIGLIKMDFLGLKTLTVIDDAIKLIKERHGVDIDIDNIDYNDQRVWTMLNEGLTKGVFQCEAGPYTNLIMKMGVHSMDELAASNALVRPGAANTIGIDYIARKQGRQSVNYPHKSMKPFLENTYGCVLYQEQVMQACVTLGGMTMAEANKVRKIIGKKKDVSEFDQYRDKFVSNASELIGGPKAEKLWHDFEAHSGYSFNLSHAVAYSTLSYQTAWLKRHYTLEFFQALLSNEKDSHTITDYLVEAKRMGIKIKFPHVNLSDVSWKIDGDGLRFGLKNIKYISDVSAERFIENRPFKTHDELVEFVTRKGSGVNSRSLTAMEMIGAANLEGFEVDRDTQLSNAYEILGLPSFNITIPTHWYAKMSNAFDYNEGDTAIMLGFVRSVKTGTGWQLYDAIDSTGSFKFFGRAGVTIEVGKSYLFIISEKAVVAALETETMIGESAIERYLNESTEDGYVVAATSRVTKAGQKMGTVIIDEGGELIAATLFPRDFSRIAPQIKKGQCYRFNIKASRNGGYVLNGVSQP